MPQLAEVIAALEGWFDPGWAESWDAIGLTCGDPAADVTRLVLAVDAVPSTVAEAEADSAQLLLTHHPLLLTAVHSVVATDPKGGLVHRMIRAGIAHYVAHTNADVADPGVSDALADRLGLTNVRPLVADPDEGPAKLVVYVPTDDAAHLIQVLTAAAGTPSGWSTVGVATRQAEREAQTRVELAVNRRALPAVLAALRRERDEPAYDVFAQLPVAGSRGTGRIGELPDPTTLYGFVSQAVQALPSTVWGVRAAGDPDRPVRRVAVCGGSGAPFIEAARRAGADAYLTADLKHHTTLETVTERGPGAMALVDAAHWATEAPWLDAVALRLRERFGTTVNVTVSATVTDPWTLHIP